MRRRTKETKSSNSVSIGFFLKVISHRTKGGALLYLSPEEVKKSGLGWHCRGKNHNGYDDTKKWVSKKEADLMGFPIRDDESPVGFRYSTGPGSKKYIPVFDRNNVFIEKGSLYESELNLHQCPMSYLHRLWRLKKEGLSIVGFVLNKDLRHEAIYDISGTIQFKDKRMKVLLKTGGKYDLGGDFFGN